MCAYRRTRQHESLGLGLLTIIPGGIICPAAIVPLFYCCYFYLHSCPLTLLLLQLAQYVELQIKPPLRLPLLPSVCEHPPPLTCVLIPPSFYIAPTPPPRVARPRISQRTPEPSSARASLRDIFTTHLTAPSATPIGIVGPTPAPIAAPTCTCPTPSHTTASHPPTPSQSALLHHHSRSSSLFFY